MINRIFKSRKGIFLFSMVLTIIGISIVNAFNYPIPIEYTFIPVLSIFLGPYAVLGFTLTEIAFEIIYFQTTDIPIILFNAAMTFIFGILPWKLWYSILNNNGHDVPNINRAINFIKLLIITVIVYLFSFGVLYNELTINESIISVYFTIILSFILTIFAIPLLHYAKIPCYSPKKQIKRLILAIYRELEEYNLLELDEESSVFEDEKEKLENLLELLIDYSSYEDEEIEIEVQNDFSVYYLPNNLYFSEENYLDVNPMDEFVLE